MNHDSRDSLSRRSVLKGVATTASAWLSACGGGSPATAETTSLEPPPAPPPPPPPVQPPPAPPAGPPVQAGAWRQLSVGGHSRKVINGSGGSSPTFRTAFAEKVDALVPQTVRAVPYRSFCRTVAGEPGIVYYNGSLHSNYPGNEIDRIDLRNLASASVQVAINHQPRVPPEGPESGYGSGSGAYVYAMYGTPLDDPGQWQPYAHHTWTKNGWHPTWGWFSQITYATGNGTTLGRNPAGTGSRYQQCNGAQGLVTYDWTEARYHVRVTQAPGRSGASDWNPHRFSLVFLETDGASRVSVKEVVDTETTARELFTFDSAALSGNTWGFAASTGGNGILVKWLEASKYLCLRMDFNRFSGDAHAFDSYHTLFLMNLEDSARKVRRLQVPAWALEGTTVAPDGNVTFCVDRNSRRIFWLVYKADSSAGARQFVRFYVSTFDAPEVWSEVKTSGLPQIVNTSVQGAWLASNREPMWFYNGHLFLILPEGGGASDPGYVNGAVNLWRVKVDAGEIPPAIVFKRLDYWAQAPQTRGFRFSNSGTAALQMIGSKHVNWAYRPADGRFYQCAGDFGFSTCQSMCTLQFDDTPRGYTFTEILDETSNAPPGKKRPASPDDGHWFHVPADSAWVEARDRFVWMRGGDGEPMFYNVELMKKYGVRDAFNPTPEQLQRAQNDGWDITSKFYVFDPGARSFDAIAGAGWTQDNGGIFWPDVWTASSAASRNGYFDPVTGCLWRFYNFGSQALGCFDFVNRKVTLFNVSSWISNETGRRIFLDGLPPPDESLLEADGDKARFCWFDSGAQRHRTYGEFSWEHKATWLDPADGKLYVVSPGTGYLWVFDTRGRRTQGSDGWQLPFAPAGDRVPLVGTYPPLRSLNSWPPAVYNGDVRMNSLLFPFKGGLLYLSCNHHDSGVSGEPHYAFWRRLGNTGPWSVVTMPLEFAANAGAARFAYSRDNNEILAISQAFTDISNRQFYRYFWRLS